MTMITFLGLRPRGAKQPTPCIAPEGCQWRLKALLPQTFGRHLGIFCVALVVRAVSAVCCTPHLSSEHDGDRTLRNGALQALWRDAQALERRQDQPLIGGRLTPLPLQIRTDRLDSQGNMSQPYDHTNERRTMAGNGLDQAQWLPGLVASRCFPPTWSLAPRAGSKLVRVLYPPSQRWGVMVWLRRRRPRHRLFLRIPACQAAESEGKYTNLAEVPCLEETMLRPGWY